MRLFAVFTIFLLALSSFSFAASSASDSQAAQVAAAVGAASGISPSPTPGFVQGRLNDIQNRLRPFTGQGPNAGQPNLPGQGNDQSGGQGNYQNPDFYPGMNPQGGFGGGYGGPQGPYGGPNDGGQGSQGGQNGIQTFNPTTGETNVYPGQDYGSGGQGNGPTSGPNGGGPGFSGGPNFGYGPGQNGPSDFRGYSQFNLRPEDFEGWVYSQIGTHLEEHYGKDAFLQKCSNQADFVNTIRDDLTKSGIDINKLMCSPIQQGLSMCQDAQKQCEQIGAAGNGPQFGPSGQTYTPTCPPDETQIKQACLTQIQNQWDQQQSDTSQNMQDQCQIQWQYQQHPQDACVNGQPRKDIMCDHDAWIQDCLSHQPPQGNNGPGNGGPGYPPQGQPQYPQPNYPNNNPNSNGPHCPVMDDATRQSMRQNCVQNNQDWSDWATPDGCPTVICRPRNQPNPSGGPQASPVSCPALDESVKQRCLSNGMAWNTPVGPNGCPYYQCMPGQPQPSFNPSVNPSQMPCPPVDQSVKTRCSSWSEQVGPAPNFCPYIRCDQVAQNTPQPTAAGSATPVPSNAVPPTVSTTPQPAATVSPTPTQVATANPTTQATPTPVVTTNPSAHADPSNSWYLDSVTIVPNPPGQIPGQSPGFGGPQGPGPNGFVPNGPNPSGNPPGQIPGQGPGIPGPQGPAPNGFAPNGPNPQGNPPGPIPGQGPGSAGPQGPAPNGFVPTGPNPNGPPPGDRPCRPGLQGAQPCDNSFNNGQPVQQGVPGPQGNPGPQFQGNGGPQAPGGPNFGSGFSPQDNCEQQWQRNQAFSAKMCQDKSQQPQFNYCDEQSFISQCVAQNQKRMDDQHAQLDTQKICDIQTRMQLREMTRYCQNAQGGKDQCLADTKKGCDFGQQNFDKCQALTSSDNVVTTIQKAVAIQCGLASGSGQPKELNQVSDLVPSDYKPLVQTDAYNVQQAQDAVKQVNQKDALYALTQIIGLQVDQEKKDAALLQSQCDQLKSTTDQLTSLSGQLDSSDAKTQLQAQVVLLQQQKDSICANAKSKQDNAAGIFSLLAGLFGGGGGGPSPSASPTPAPRGTA